MSTIFPRVSETTASMLTEQFQETDFLHDFLRDSRDHDSHTWHSPYILKQKRNQNIQWISFHENSTIYHWQIVFVSWKELIGNIYVPYHYIWHYNGNW